jgi:hypothetical protein
MGTEAKCPEQGGARHKDNKDGGGGETAFHGG